MGSFLCARHWVNYITFIDSIKCLPKEYTEAFHSPPPPYLAQGWFPEEAGGKRRYKICDWGRASGYELHRNLQMRSQRNRSWCKSLGSFHIGYFDLVSQNDSWFRLKWTNLLPPPPPRTIQKSEGRVHDCVRAPSVQSLSLSRWLGRGPCARL